MNKKLLLFVMILFANTLSSLSCMNLQTKLTRLKTTLEDLQGNLAKLRGSLEGLKGKLGKPGKVEEKKITIFVIPTWYESKDNNWYVLLGHDSIGYSDQWDDFWELTPTSNVYQTALTIFKEQTNSVYDLPTTRAFAQFSDKQHEIFFIVVDLFKLESFLNKHAKNNRKDDFAWVPAHELLGPNIVQRKHARINTNVNEEFRDRFTKYWPAAKQKLSKQLPKPQAETIYFFYDDKPTGGAANNYGDPTNYFLGNFWPSNITMTIKGKSYTFQNAEAAYQASKFQHKPQILKTLTQITTGYGAWDFANPWNNTQKKRVAHPQAQKLDPNYTAAGIPAKYKGTLAWMYHVVWAKFKDPELARKLKATGNAELIEWTVNDGFWGMVRQSPDVPGVPAFGKNENWLGKILMEVRDILP